MHASAREPVNADFERLVRIGILYNIILFYSINSLQQNFSPNAILESYSDDEPEFMLALVHTERDLVQAEKRAADLRLKASCLRVRLLRLQSDRAARQLAEAELRVGRVNSSITRTGRHPYISVKTALDRYGNKRECSVLSCNFIIINISEHFSHRHALQRGSCG